MKKSIAVLACVIAGILIVGWIVTKDSNSQLSDVDSGTEMSYSAEETETSAEETETSAEETETSAEETAEEDSEETLQLVTLTYDNIAFLESVANQKAYNTDVSCTGMQGMDASERYLYVAKQKNNQYAILVQYDVENGSQRTMTYYADLDAVQPSAFDSGGHCNELSIYTDNDGEQYMLVATALTPDALSAAGPCLSRMKLDEENAAVRLTGYFDLIATDDEGRQQYLSAGAVRVVAQTQEYHYLLIKNTYDFYWCKLPVGASGGTEDAPERLACTRLFTIDNRNAIFTDRKGKPYTIDNLESWTNQGFFYSSEEELLYVPVFNYGNGALAGKENAIIVYDVKGMLDPGALEAAGRNQNRQIHPTTLSFHFGYLWEKLFEIESCVFLKNQDEDGDLSLYFNTNGSSVEEFEGIWKFDYMRGGADAQPIVGEDAIIYTVSYHYNVEGVDASDWLQNLPTANYNMLRDTTHIAGITTNLRINCFTREDYVFIGWHLYRHSDGKWLYADSNWYTEQEAPAGLEKRLIGDAAPIDQLTTVDGDEITAYAQWM